MQLDLSAYLAQYNIAASNLTPAQKTGISEVLRAGGTAAILALTRILTQEAGKYTTTASPASQTQQQQAAQAALDAADQAEANRLRTRRQRFLIGGIVGAAVLLVAGLWLWLRHHKKTTAHAAN